MSNWLPDLDTTPDPPRGGFKSPHQVMSEHPGGLEGFLNPHEHAKGIPWAWPKLNDLTGGLHAGELLLLAARPSQGKSAMGWQQAVYAAHRGLHSVWCGFEMSSASMLHRAIAFMAGVDLHVFLRHGLNEEGRRRVTAAAGELSELPIHLDDKDYRTSDQIFEAVLHLKKRVDVSLVGIDYLGLMSGEGESRYYQVSKISRELKVAATELDLPFLVMAQLGRANEKENRRPVLSDLRDSGTLEQDANTVLFLHRPPEENLPSQRRTIIPTTLIIAKQRQGPLDDIQMNFVAANTKFEEAPNTAEATVE